MSEGTPGHRICVAGAGGIGCFFGGVLAAAGHDVRFLERAKILTAVAQDGLRLTDCDGLDLHLSDLSITQDAGAALDGADLVLIA